MDAGLTGLLGGVIGAAVGALGTTAGAWITGRKAETQAHVQAQAQLAQIRMQLHADHVRAHNESRRAVYADFITRHEDFIEFVDERWRLGFPSSMSWEEASGIVATVKDLEHALRRAWSYVAVEGPDDVVKAAVSLLLEGSKIRRAVIKDAGHVHASEFDEVTRRDECIVQVRAYNKSADAFVHAARHALRDDGIVELPPQ